MPGSNCGSCLADEAGASLTEVQQKITGDPTGDYSDYFLEIKQLVDELNETLRGSTLAADHTLRATAKTLKSKLGDVRVKKLETASDSKDFFKRGDSDSTFKLPKINIPKFKGGLENWQGYWGRFQTAVHDNEKLDNDSKMVHLMETITDPALSEYLVASNDGRGRYPEVIAYLKQRFDRPRELHSIHCKTLAELQPIKGSNSELSQAVDTVFAAVTGLIRHGQSTINHIATSLVVPILPKQLRQEWETKTEEQKEVPDIFDWIEFVRKKATSSHLEQKAATVLQPQDSRKHNNRHQPAKQKGSVHVAVNQQPEQPSPSPSTGHRNKGAQHRTPRGSQHPVCKHVCNLCNDTHYVYACSAFNSMTVPQRMEHVRAQSLCQNCLKPGHTSADCRSEYRCRVCRGDHNTMLHSGSNGSTPLTVSGTTNHATSHTEVLDKGKLLMTCQVLVTGPTGKSMLVRTLLDSGSTLSLVTNKVAKHLSLKKLSTSMTVAALGDVITEPASPTTPITISSLYRKDWSAEVTAVITQKISGNLPQVAASSVRNLPNIKGLQLADPHFDSPGRIDLLLGEDVLADVLMLAGPKGTAKATETVFGRAIRGLYTPDGADQTKQAAVHLASKEPAEATEPEKITTDALVRFWESEEPSKPASLLSPEESKVQEHYESTHMFIPSAGRYMVTLPKKEQDLTLGESRRQAVKRFHSNERSLLHKGNWDKFQAVIQEYLDLNHAQPVTAQEMETPVKDCYYLPMHGVHKQSSSTTKLRVVFDASAQTSTKISLNDTLAVGPTLHPTLDRILIWFRTYKIAITGDISKMYREVLLSPPDRQLHRFLWRPQTDQPILDFFMNRVTFGVASSPYLAVKTLQQTATDFGSSSPNASWHVTHSFYVDDLLGGADTVEQALELHQDLREILGKGGGV